MLIAGNDIPTEREHAAISKQGCNFSLRSLPALEYGMDYLLKGRQGPWNACDQRAADEVLVKKSLAKIVTQEMGLLRPHCTFPNLTWLKLTKLKETQSPIPTPAVLLCPFLPAGTDPAISPCSKL